MKKTLFTITFILLISGFTFAQGYKKGMMTAGVSINTNWHLGLGGTINYEYGKGLLFDNIGIGVDAGYMVYSKKYNPPAQYYGLEWYKFTYSSAYFMPEIIYHVWMNKILDPYAKVGVGFFFWKNKYIDSRSQTAIAGSIQPELGKFHAWPVFQGGIRYWKDDKMALKAEVGFPYLLNVGVDYFLK